MMVFSRSKAIQELIENDMDTISNDMSWLDTILRNGFTGYNDQTDIMLEAECFERDIPRDHYMEEQVKRKIMYATVAIYVDESKYDDIIEDMEYSFTYNGEELLCEMVDITDAR
jgi:hypothetical protein